MRAVIRGGVVLVVGLVAASAAAAANWLVVASERGEIDLARVARLGDGKTAAWNRLVLGRELQDPDKGSYNAVEALNHYDCRGRQFTTVKRVYLRDGKPVRSESVAATKSMAVAG